MASVRLSTLFTMQHAGRWSYRGEGAANVVVCYTGDEADLVGKVLRISKAAASKERSAALHVSLQQEHFDLNAGRQVENSLEASEEEVCKSSPGYLGSPGGATSIASGADQLKEGPRPELAKAGVSRKESPLLEPLEQDVWGKLPTLTGAKTGVELHYEYAKHVMAPLLGEDFVDAGIPVPATADFLDPLIANIEDSRPARWRKEGPLLLMSDWALLITDHTSPHLTSGSGQTMGGSVSSRGASICLEIKPKAGFLPKSNCISPENGVKLTKSRYELMQYLKARQGKVDAISSYNPLDLFSSDSGQVRRAIDSLFDNPQNNLRVFVDGELITLTSDVGAEGGGRSEIESALDDFCAPVDGSRLNVLKKLVVERLAGSVLLQKLRDTQMLDRYDIEGVIHLYRSLCGHTVDEATVDHLPAATKELLSLPREAHLDILRDYMIATTAKDCGLMLTFAPLEAEAAGELQGATSNPLVQNLQGRCYLSKVGYVDLDLKRLKKLPKYWELDQQILAAYGSGSQI